MTRSMVFAPVLGTSGALPVAVSPRPLSYASLSSEPHRLQRGNPRFALLILSARLRTEVFLRPLPFSRLRRPPCGPWSTAGLQNFDCKWVWRSAAR